MNHFYKVPTIQHFSGEKGFAYINPALVSAVEPEVISNGDLTEITGTRVVTPKEVYFVPLPVPDVADKLNIVLHG